MPLRRRLLVLVALVLGACLLVGGALTYWAGLRKIELEMSSAIAVGSSAVMDALSSIETSSDPATQVIRIVGAFDGDRHLVARLVAPDGTVKSVSNLKAPVDPPPAWLYKLLEGNIHTQTFTLPDNLRHLGSITLEADPHNEVGEVWERKGVEIFLQEGASASANSGASHVTKVTKQRAVDEHVQQRHHQPILIMSKS